jgi:transposase
VIQVPTGTKIWIAAGVTDMRRGFDGLSAQVQTILQQQPFSGHVFCFRGRRGDIVKLHAAIESQCAELLGDHYGAGLCILGQQFGDSRFEWVQLSSAPPWRRPCGRHLQIFPQRAPPDV